MMTPQLSKTNQRQFVVSVENSDTNLHSVKFANASDHQVVWRLTTSHADDIAVEPQSGVVPPRETGEMTIRRENPESDNSDIRQPSVRRVGIEWVRAPTEAKDGDVSEEWFNGDAIVHKKYFNIAHDELLNGLKRAKRLYKRDELLRNKKEGQKDSGQVPANQKADAN
ncbi:unnamed protein product [Heligmosomoides polygyrus]|uniref:Major sperm protein n=1 Tax=Heligmosomoides polygyrus TaxID=6339 RepID=A0A183FNV6_HELPZ|nr:unnamed protein product [Heligmosomoides polygyrus]